MSDNPFAPKMTEAQRKEAMRRYGVGESLNRIARDFGIGSASLTKTLKKRGLVLRKNPHRQVHLSPAVERRIIDSYVTGKAVRAIATEQKVSTGIAWRTIKESGAYKPAQIRRSTGWTKRRFKEELSHLVGKLGRIPTVKEWYRAGRPSEISFTYKWGKRWNELVEEAGFTPHIKTGWTKDRLRRQFLKLSRQGKVLPLRESLNQCEELPSTQVIKNLFGSFRAFLGECGVETISKQSLCYQWEYCCEQIARHMFGKIVAQSLDTHVEGRPDIVVPDRMLIIDAMTTAYMVPHKLSEIQRYRKGYTLEFWCLFTIGKEYPGIRYRYADELLQTKGIPPAVKRIGRELAREYRSPAYRKELLDILSRHYADTGKIPTTTQLHGIGAPTGAIYHREFGGFEKALKLAGCPERPPHHRHEDEAIAQYLKKLHQRFGRPISPKDLRRSGDINRRTVVIRFGSFEKACHRAGVPCRRLVVTKRVSDDDILNIVREVHAKTKMPVSSKSIRLSGRIKTDTIIKRFGSLEHSCGLAGVPFEKLIGGVTYTDAAINRHLRTLHKNLGRPLTSVDIKQDTTIPWWTINTRFGNPEKACNAIGVPFKWINRRMSDSDILDAVRAVYANTGKPVSASSLRSNKKSCGPQFPWTPNCGIVKVPRRCQDGGGREVGAAGSPRSGDLRRAQG